MIDAFVKGFVRLGAATHCNRSEVMIKASERSR